MSIRDLWSDRVLLSFVRRCVRDSIPERSFITSPYGKERATNKCKCGKDEKSYRLHWGTDVQWGGPGASSDHKMRDVIVEAPFSAIVLEVHKDTGKVTIVDHHGRFVVFRHLDRISVGKGQVLMAGYDIGHVGSKAATNVHLHIEVGVIHNNSVIVQRDIIQ
jgi:murein DD-endopeptidase MepM/ murein hydrolase activator NlpD